MFHILSKSHCLEKKRIHAKYASAGVREYWIIDIDARTVVVYDFEHESLPKICGFDMPVPVGIWNGRCTVDFADILAKL